MFSKLFELLPFLRTVADAWNKTMAFLTARENKQAGRDEMELEQRNATDAEIDKAVAARRDERDHVARDPDSLRAPDKYSRD